MQSSYIWNLLRLLLLMLASAASISTGALAQAETAPTPSQPAVRYKMVDGANLTYEEEGRGPLVVFVHGAVGDYRVWDGERKAIAKDHHFVALTLRYFGKGSWPDDGKNFSYKQEAEDIAEFIKALHERPAYLVSWSMSGPLALVVATKHPELLRGMFLYEPTIFSFITDPDQAKIANASRSAAFGPIHATLKAGGPVAAAKMIPGAVNGQPNYFATSAPTLQAIVLDNARTIPLIFSDKPPTVTCEQLRHLKMPVTVARGENTIPFYRITAAAVAGCIPGAKLVVLPNDRHMAPVDDPRAVADAILKGVAKHEAEVAVEEAFWACHSERFTAAYERAVGLGIEYGEEDAAWSGSGS